MVYLVSDEEAIVLVDVEEEVENNKNEMVKIIDDYLDDDIY